MQSYSIYCIITQEINVISVKHTHFFSKACYSTDFIGSALTETIYMGEIGMKKGFISKIALLLLMTVVVVSFAGCSKIETMKRINEKNVVIMGTNAEFPPFEYRNDKGEVEGFDVAMAQEIAKELGVELQIQDMAFDSLLNALASGKIDFVAAGMTVKPDRLKNADFSIPYYKATQSIIIKKDNDSIKSLADLKGKKIGVQQGTTGDFMATDDIEDTKVSRFKKAIDAVMDLKNGKVDAVIVDSNPAKIFVSKNDDIKLLATQTIIVSKGNDSIKGKEDLKGQKIGVQQGTAGDFMATEVGAAEVSRFEKAADAVKDLKDGKVDAVITDFDSAKKLVGENDDVKLFNAELTDEDYAVAVRKNDKEFLDAINKAIKNMKDSGKYDELVKQYIEE